MTTPAELDALIERINALADCSYWATAGWDIPGDATQVIGRLAVQAAAAITELRAEYDALKAERDALQGECERLSDAARLATIDLAGVAELQRDSRRLHWLHSQASCKPDIQGCEWGIWRVSWEGGRASHVWATNSDFSDLDAAMKLAEDYAAIDAAKEKP